MKPQAESAPPDRSFRTVRVHAAILQSSRPALSLADRRRRLRRLTPARPSRKLYTRTYTLRRPLFPARLAARGPRWLRKAIASSAQPTSKHRPRKLARSARHAVGSCYCSAACGAVLAAATPSATDARAKCRTLSHGRCWYRLQDTGKGDVQMIRTMNHFARQNCSKAGRARPPPLGGCERRICRGRLRRLLGRRHWLE